MRIHSPQVATPIHGLLTASAAAHKTAVITSEHINPTSFVNNCCVALSLSLSLFSSCSEFLCFQKEEMNWRELCTSDSKQHTTCTCYLFRFGVLLQSKHRGPKWHESAAKENRTKSRWSSDIEIKVDLATLNTLLKTLSPYTTLMAKLTYLLWVPEALDSLASRLWLTNSKTQKMCSTKCSESKSRPLFIWNHGHFCKQHAPMAWRLSYMLEAFNHYCVEQIASSA